MSNYEYRNMDEARGRVFREMGEQKGDEYRGKARKNLILSLIFEAITCFGVVGAMFCSRREGYWTGINVMTDGSMDDPVRKDVESSDQTIAE